MHTLQSSALTAYGNRARPNHRKNLPNPVGELDSLIADNLLTEKEADNGFGAPSFSFEAMPQLDAVLDELAVEKEPAWAPAARKLAGYNSQTLEGISTILYLKRCGFEGAQLKHRLVSLKPHLADQYDHCEREANSLVQNFAAPCTEPQMA